MDYYAGHGHCPTRFRLLLFSLLIPFPFPLSTLFFFSLLCVASRHTKTAVTLPLVDAPRVAARRRKREFEFALFQCACHTHAERRYFAPYVIGASTIYCTDAPVIRLHHLSHGPDRAHRIFRARNRRASRKTIRACECVYKCSCTLQISLTRIRGK